MQSYHALHVGINIQEYTIEKVLGEGGFGLTYLALWYRSWATQGEAPEIKRSTDQPPLKQSSRDNQANVTPKAITDIKTRISKAFNEHLDFEGAQLEELKKAAFNLDVSKSEFEKVLTEFKQKKYVT